MYNIGSTPPQATPCSNWILCFASTYACAGGMDTQACTYTATLPFHIEGRQGSAPTTGAALTGRSHHHTRMSSILPLTPSTVPPGLSMPTPASWVASFMLSTPAFAPHAPSVSLAPLAPMLLALSASAYSIIHKQPVRADGIHTSHVVVVVDEVVVVVIVVVVIFPFSDDGSEVGKACSSWVGICSNCLGSIQSPARTELSVGSSSAKTTDHLVEPPFQFGYLFVWIWG